MHASNGPREGTSRILFPPPRWLRGPAAQESGSSITGWYGPMSTMPLIGPEADSRPGKRRTDQVSWCAIRRRAGCSEGGIYATVWEHSTCCSKERLFYRWVVRADGPDATDPVGRPTSGRKIGKLPPKSPRGWRAGGLGSVNKVFTATFQLVTVG